jgi:predicted Zn-dependent peptidase
VTRTWHQEHWDNGLTVLIEPLNRPAAATCLLLPTGAAADPAGREGAANVLHNFCQRGAGERDTRALNEAIESLGARRGGAAGRETTTWSLTCLAPDWAEALALVLDSVRRPCLPDEAFESVRALGLQEVAGLDDEPGRKVLMELTRRFFPTPYGRSLVGSRDSLTALAADDLRRQWQATYQPQGAILAIAGGLDLDAARETAKRLLADWQGAADPAPAAQPRSEAVYEHVTSATEQVHIALAWRDVAADDPGRYHSQMAVQVLSGGMGARLFTEVREKRGLCYAVGASGQTVRGCGYVIARAGTTTERSSETLEVLAGELTRLPGSVTADEVERAKVRLLSNEVMNDEITSARAQRAASDWWLLGRVRSPEEVRAGIEAVSAASLNQFLEAHRPGDFTIVTLGPQFDWPAGLSL